jgi:MYXO-CTERM domain-containing protein
VSDLCIDVNCPPGQACNPVDGQCISDPCRLVSCPSGYSCEVGFDANGSCVKDEVGRGPLIVAAGGGCNAGDNGSGGAGLMALFLGVLLVLRRRR